MRDETPIPETPTPAKKLPQAFVDNMIKPGEQRNPLGRPPGVKNASSKVLAKLSQIWGRAEAPDDWFGPALALVKKAGMTIDELIMLRVKWCLATNTKYQNPALYKEERDRREGKIPLRVLTKPGDDGDVDDFEQLTNEELKAYVDDMDRRARLVAAREESKRSTEQPQLAEDNGGPTTGE
jgi:hypothetical protein